MRKRHPNHRLVKTDLSYTVEEIARLLSKHRNTVRDWINRGLPTIDHRRPILIHGGDLRAFLLARRLRNKQKCGPDEIYCVRCRAPKRPAGDMADYLPTSSTTGSLCGICPTCDSIIYRRTSLAKVSQICGGLNITMSQGRSHIGDSF
jgi:Helix-turn-helix domain